MLGDDKFEIQHLIPILQKRGINFVAPIPRDECILIDEQRTIYLPTDKNLLNDCKNYDKVKICQRLQPTYLISKTQAYENQIIRASIKTLDYKVCQVSPIKIELLTYITLAGRQGYILIPENDFSLNVNCPHYSKEVVIHEATLIRSIENCVLNSKSNIIKLKKPLKVYESVTSRDVYNKYNNFIII